MKSHNVRYGKEGGEEGNDLRMDRWCWRLWMGKGVVSEEEGEI